MNVPDDVFTVFSVEIETKDGTPVITVPERELRTGDLAVGDTYRIAVLPPAETEPGSTSGDTDREPSRDRQRARSGQEPPVEEGETLDVEIEDVGDQGDGIARVGPGYIVFVSDTDVGDRVTVEITQAQENFAFAEVVEEEPISDEG